MQFTISFTLMSMLLAGGIAIAQSPSEAQSQIKPLKYVPKLSELFYSADRDGDGALTRTEAGEANMGRTVQYFNYIDTNHDGKVTLEEMRALIRNRITT
jgi:Ca2+-binding EF-hand superfamily protein